MAKTWFFFSTAIVAELFFSLFTWKRHHYLMRGHWQEFHIPTANWNLPRLACFFAIFSLPEFSWFFFQFFISLWWEQMQKKQHKEDASALLKFGLIIMSFPFFFVHPPAPSPQKYKFWALNISLSLKIFQISFKLLITVIRIRYFPVVSWTENYLLGAPFKLKWCSPHWSRVVATREF